MKVAAAGRRVLARVQGPLDGHSTPQLISGLPAAPYAHLILDLRGAAYIDSNGIRALVRFSEELERCGSTLRLVMGRDSRIRRTLALLSLTERFRAADTVSEAWRPGHRSRGVIPV